MYKVFPSSQYRKSVKKLKRSGKFKEEDLRKLLRLLAAGKTLPKKYEDHKLTGELQDCRECHIKFDLLLLYKIYKNQLILILLDIGDHDDLFGK